MAFYVPEGLAGKSLEQLFRESESRGEYFPRLDILSGQLGISPSTPFTAGQRFGGPTDPGSGEYQYASRLFSQTPPATATTNLPGATVPGATGDIFEQAKKLVQFQTEQNRPVITSLEAQRQPLIDRYAALLDEIKNQQGRAEQRESTTTAREFGRRGIPLSSGLYDVTLGERLAPISREFTNLYQQTAAGRESDLLTLARQIAELQAGQPQTAFQQALGLGGFQQQAQSLAAQIASQQAQQDIARQQLALSERELALKERAPTSAGLDTLYQRIFG